jgi:FkbM family methyltransferase
VERRALNTNYYYYLSRRLVNPRPFSRRQTRNVVSMFGFSRSIIKWFEDDARRLIYEHDLTSESLIMDVGGYLGRWSEEMFDRYRCRILIYEPVQQYYMELVRKFKHNPKIDVFGFGLGAKNGGLKISVRGVQSSAFLMETDDTVETIRIVDIVEAIAEHKKIDLISINIEGGEYTLLERLVESGIATKFGNIQVQFHEWFPSYSSSHILRQNLHKNLSETHMLTYNYPFVWENWRLLQDCNRRSSC